MLLQPLEEEGVSPSLVGLGAWGGAILPQGKAPWGGLPMLPAALGLAGDGSVIVPGAKHPLHQPLPLLLLLGQLLEQPGGERGMGWHPGGSTDWHPGGGGHGLAQGPVKPYLPVSVRSWQSCATSTEGACREGRGSTLVLGPVLSPELVLPCWARFLGVDSLCSMGSLSPLVSLVLSPPRQPAFGPRSVGAEAVVGTERCLMASDPRAQGTKGGAGPSQGCPSAGSPPHIPFPAPQSPPAHPGPAALFLHPPSHGGRTGTHVPAVPQCHPPLTSTVKAACTAWLTALSSANIQWGLM